MTKRAVLVSVHSRKGGVGKTSIVMSSAIQLAALGKKVALLDLDTHGAHLSQSLPLKGHLSQVDGFLCFDPQKARTTESRGFLAGRFSGKKIKLNEVAQQLMSDGAAFGSGATSEISQAFRKLDKNLFLFPMSPYIRDVDMLNDLTLKDTGQKEYRRVLSQLFQELDEQNYDFVLLDNSPGLSLNPGLTLQAAFEEFRQERRVHSWFVSNAPWWEQGLIVYELNIFKTHLEATKVITTLIVNRVGERWIDDEEFEVGKEWIVKRNTEQFKKVVERLFCIPMWMIADLDTHRLANRFLLPERFGISVLGDDDSIRKAQTTEGDYRKAGAAPNGMEVITHDCRKDFALLATRYLKFFALPALNAVHENTKSARGKGKKHPADLQVFHQSVNTALVQPLVEFKNE